MEDYLTLEQGAKRVVVLIAPLIRRYYYSTLISYDEAFDTRVSAEISIRFGGPIPTSAKKKKGEIPIISLKDSPKHRNAQVYDCKAGACPQP